MVYAAPTPILFSLPLCFRSYNTPVTMPLLYRSRSNFILAPIMLPLQFASILLPRVARKYKSLKFQKCIQKLKYQIWGRWDQWGRIKTGSKFRPPQYYRPKIRGRQTTPIWVSTDSAQSPDSKMTKNIKNWQKLTNFHIISKLDFWKYFGLKTKVRQFWCFWSFWNQVIELSP